METNRTEALRIFRDLLQERDESTYIKWYHNTYVVCYGSMPQEYTARELDILNCASIHTKQQLGLL